MNVGECLTACSREMFPKPNGGNKRGYFAGLDVGVLAGGELVAACFVGHDAGAFYDGEHLVGGVRVRPGTGAVLEEDGGQGDFLAVGGPYELLGVDAALEVLGGGGGLRGGCGRVVPWPT